MCVTGVKRTAIPMHFLHQRTYQTKLLERSCIVISLIVMLKDILDSNRVNMLVVAV